MAGRHLVPAPRSARRMVLAECAGAGLVTAVLEVKFGRGLGQFRALPGGIGDGHRVQQRARIGMRGPVVHIGGVALLDDAPPDHDRDAMRDRAHDRQVMRDEEIGETEPLLQRLQQLHDLHLRAHVEGGDRLVADHEIGADGERAGDDDALALSAREFVRIAARESGVEPDQPQQLSNT